MRNTSHKTAIGIIRDYVNTCAGRRALKAHELIIIAVLAIFFFIGQWAVFLMH